MSTISADITRATARRTTGDGDSLGAAVRACLRTLHAMAAPWAASAAGDQVGESATQSVAVRIRDRLRRSAHEKKPMTMVVFELGDLPLVETVFGAVMAHEVLDHVSDKLQRLAGRSGLSVRTSPSEFTVLLPWADSERAVDTVHAAFGRPCRVEFEMDHAEILLLPHVEVSTLDCESTSIDATYHKLRHQIAQARLHEEERHARDLNQATEIDFELDADEEPAHGQASIAASVPFAETDLESAATEPARLESPAPRAREISYIAIPPTIPMPLAMH